MKRHLTLVAMALFAGGCASAQQQQVKRGFEPQDLEETEAILAWDGEYVFDQITNGTDPGVLNRAEYWCAYHSGVVIPRLIEMLGDASSAPAVHASMGGAAMTSVAGRASWYLTSITGRDFGAVGADPRADDLVALRTEWDSWWVQNRRWWWD